MFVAIITIIVLGILASLFTRSNESNNTSYTTTTTPPDRDLPQINESDEDYGFSEEDILEILEVEFTIEELIEINEDLPDVLDDIIYTTDDDKGEVCWNNGILQSVGFKDGVKYDSFEEFFEKEKMHRDTYDELEDTQRRFENACMYLIHKKYQPSNLDDNYNYLQALQRFRNVIHHTAIQKETLAKDKKQTGLKLSSAQNEDRTVNTKSINKKPGLVINYIIKRVIERSVPSERKLSRHLESETQMNSDALAEYITSRLGLLRSEEGYATFKARVIRVEGSNLQTFAFSNAFSHGAGFMIKGIYEDTIDLEYSKWRNVGIPVDIGVHNIFEYHYLREEIEAVSFIIDYGSKDSFIMIASYWIEPQSSNIINFYETAVSLIESNQLLDERNKGNSILVDSLYDFISERSMTIGLTKHFLYISEDNQLMLGLELLALRIWAVNYSLFHELGNDQGLVISQMIDKKLQEEYSNFFDFIVNRTILYNGLSKLSNPVTFITAQFESNIKEIVNLPIEAISEQISTYIDESRKYTRLYS